MVDPQAFVLGFLFAGLVGALSGLIWRGWGIIELWRRLMFTIPPQPALRPIARSPNRTVGADPQLSPLQVLGTGCMTIFGQLMFQIILMGSILLLIQAVFFQVVVTQEFLTGILFAAAAGFLLQYIRLNWLIIAGLYSRIINPPQPILRPITPPNDHHPAARPAEPAFAVVFYGSIEILGRLILEVVLIFLLILLIRAAFVYLETGTIFPPAGGEGFGT